MGFDPNTRDLELTMPAARLAMAAPREWTEFVEGFKKYADGALQRMMQGQPDTILRLQGMAQQCSQLVPLLQDAVQTANRVSSSGGRKPQT
jgi:hypothetical protein